MRLSDVWMAFVFLAFAMYVGLDGYDLGIGVMTLFERDDHRRRGMYELVARAWDANESWLVLLALTLWGGLPLVYGIALPGLYIPLILMLFSLIIRGVSIEMLAQYGGWHRRWGRAFGFGSLSAGFCQGAAFGGLLAGLPSHGTLFSGGPFSFLHDGYAILTGVTALILYCLAGAAWVYAKAEGAVQARAVIAGRGASLLLVPATVACWLLLSAVGPTSPHTGGTARLVIWCVGGVVLATGLAYAYYAFGRHPDKGPVFGALGGYLGGLMILTGLMYPYVLPPHVTVHEAASPGSTLIFLIAGVGACLPVIFTYQAFAYRAFRGKLIVDDETAAPAGQGGPRL